MKYNIHKSIYYNHFISLNFPYSYQDSRHNRRGLMCIIHLFLIGSRPHIIFNTKLIIDQGLEINSWKSIFFSQNSNTKGKVKHEISFSLFEKKLFSIFES